MVEKELIQLRGFHNTVDENGEITGFQVCVRTGYYRGLWLSQFRPGPLVVDGEVFPRESLIWEIGGIQYTADEMRMIGDVYWQYATPATIHVRKPGGLSQGYHHVEFTFGWLCNYMARIDPDYGTNFAGYHHERTMLLV